MRRIKMRKIVFFSVLTFLIMLFAVTVYGADYFLYDGETNKILNMGDKDSTFTDRIQMDKRPEYMMPTSDPKKFLAIFLPENDLWTSKGFSFFKRKEKTENIPGQLILFNINTGRTEDLVDLGYAPFTYEYTEDHKHFFITYHTVSLRDDANAPMEMLHYNLTTQKSEKITLPSQIKTVQQIAINPEANKVYVLGDNMLLHQSAIWIGFKVKPTVSGTPELTTLNYSPLKVSSSMPLDYTPLSFYLLSKDRGVLLAQNYKYFGVQVEYQKGIIEYLDLKTNSVIEEQQVDFNYILTQWFKKEKILALIGFQKKIGNFLKITANGLQKNQINGNFSVCDYEYFPDKDCFYILTDLEFQVVDFKANVINKFDTDSNWYKNTPYSIYRIPDSDIEVLYCFEGGKVKFFDLKENKLISQVSCGRTGLKIFKSIITGGHTKASNAVVSTNPDKTNFYIYNELTNDITVYDQSFKSKSYIVLPEKGLGMYMLKKPVLQTLVVSNKNIFQLDYATQTLKSIYQFKENAAGVLRFDDPNRIILTTDRELVVIDPISLAVKYQVSYYVDKKEQYSKIKPGEQRYEFIFNL